MTLFLALTLHPGVYVAVGIALLVVVLIIGSFLSVWLKAWSSGAPVGLVNLITMRYLRKLPHSLIVDARIRAVKAGIPITVDEFETRRVDGRIVIEPGNWLTNLIGLRSSLPIPPSAASLRKSTSVRPMYLYRCSTTMKRTLLPA